MNHETLLGALFIPVIAHAGLAFFQSFRKGPSQHQALLDIQINGLSSPIGVQQLFDIQLLTNKFCCRDLLTAALIWSQRLRTIGFIPILLYLFFVFLLIAKPAFTKETNVELLSSILVGLALSLQLLYVFLKVFSKIPDLLIHLHPDYKGSGFLPILFDIKPLWKN
jgi:hypothetical protein